MRIDGDRINGLFHLPINGIYYSRDITDQLIRSPLIRSLPGTSLLGFFTFIHGRKYMGNLYFCSVSHPPPPPPKKKNGVMGPHFLLLVPWGPLCELRLASCGWKKITFPKWWWNMVMNPMFRIRKKSIPKANPCKDQRELTNSHRLSIWWSYLGWSSKYEGFLGPLCKNQLGPHHSLWPAKISTIL